MKSALTPERRRVPNSPKWTNWKDFTREDLVADVGRLVLLVDRMGRALVEVG